MIVEELIKAATCQVRCGTENGTGWLVAPGLVVTARHCVDFLTTSDEPPKLIVEFGLGSEAASYEATVELLSPDYDLACLKLTSEVPLQPIPVASELVRAGSRWFAFGRPVSKLDIGHRLEGTVSQVLSGLPSGIDIELAVDAATALSDYEGLSGSAVITDEGCIGILISSTDTALGCIGVARLKPLLSQLGILSDDTDASERRPASKLVSRTEFQDEFETSVISAGGGFWFLEGAPGIGKSTFLAEFEPRSSQLEVLGIYSFSDRQEGRTAAYWAQPDVFEDWLAMTYSAAASGAPARLVQKSYAAMMDSTTKILNSFASRCLSEGKVGLLFIDAINEADRADTEALNRLLRMLPMSLGGGLAVVFSSTTFENVTPTLGRRIAGERRMVLPGLARDGIAAFCLQELEDERSTVAMVAKICDRAAGHPLYLRYLIDLVNGGATEGDLDALPEFSGDVEDYYQSVWEPLATDANSVHALGIMARLRWGIPTSEFLSFLGPDEKRAFGITLPRIRHLLSDDGTTSIYHSSFAQFLVTKTEHFGADIHSQLSREINSDYAVLNRVYHGLRGVQTSIDEALSHCDQNWIDKCVLLGVVPDALLEDVDDSVTAATESGKAVETVRLLLLSQRVRHRYNILFVDQASIAARALVSLGRGTEALRFLVREGHLIGPFDDALAVAVQLIQENSHNEAYALLEKLDTRLFGYLDQQLSLNQLVGLVKDRTCVLILMDSIGQKSTFDDLPTFLGGINSIIQNPSKEATRRELAALRQMDSDVVVAMCSFLEDASVMLGALSEKANQEFFGSLRSLASILSGIRENTELYRQQPDRVALADLLRRFEEVAQSADLPSAESCEAIADTVLIHGGSVAAVRALCGESLGIRPLRLEFFKENRALVDVTAFLKAYALHRLKGFTAGVAIALPEIRRSTDNWRQSLELLATDLARLDGMARAAKVSSNTEGLAAIYLEMEGRIFPGLQFQLSERVKWKESYAVPEQVIPFLYKLLARLYMDCFKEHLGRLATFVDSSFATQCGMYSEGFRQTLWTVFDVITTETIRPELVPSLMGLAMKWKVFVLGSVQNRAELVPELLKMVPIFASLGAVEEASRTYQAALSNSLGPHWYKEDQFSLMVKTLKRLPANDSAGMDALPAVETYLDAAGGELTFQRFVRYAKQTLLGELCRRGRHHQAVRLFSRQMYGTQDELYSQATEGESDRVSLLVGMRFPGSALDEQAGIIELIEGCMDGGSWRTPWILLEIFQEGDERHLDRWGKAYARLMNRHVGQDRDVKEMSDRMRALSSRSYEAGDWNVLLKAFLEELAGPLRLEFADMEPADPTATAGTADSSSGAAIGPVASAESTLDVVPRSSEKVERTSDEELDHFFVPGMFGKQSALREASTILASADQALAIRNFEQANLDATRALSTIQEGGWSIWQDSSEAVRRAESIVELSGVDASQITKLYGPLLQSEEHNFRWIAADRFIERIAGKLDALERRALCEVVLDHTRLILGASAPTLGTSAQLGAEEHGASTALFALLIWTLDHPSPMTRQRAARGVLWLMQHDDEFLRYTAPIAMSMRADNAPDILCGALDVLSADSPLQLWSRFEACFDVVALPNHCEHVGRFAAMLRIARRASQAGVATAQELSQRLDLAWQAALKDTEEDSVPAVSEIFMRAVDRSWRKLESAGLATPRVAWRAEQIFGQVCAPFTPAVVEELEHLSAQAFRIKKNAPLGRWEARGRFALQKTLFTSIPRDKLERADELLRVCNPSVLRSPNVARFPLLQFLKGQTRHWRQFKPENENQVFLCYQGIVVSAGKAARIEVIAFIRYHGTGFAFPPAMQSSFKSTQSPRPGVNDPALVCAFVDPEMVFFGGLTPAILQPRFADFVRAPAGAVHRAVWYDWTDRDGDQEVFAPENAMLSIDKNALRIPDGQRLAWVVRFDGQVVGVIN